MSLLIKKYTKSPYFAQDANAIIPLTGKEKRL